MVTCQDCENCKLFFHENLGNYVCRSDDIDYMAYDVYEEIECSRFKPNYGKLRKVSDADFVVANKIHPPFAKKI